MHTGHWNRSKDLRVTRVSRKRALHLRGNARQLWTGKQWGFCKSVREAMALLRGQGCEAFTRLNPVIKTSTANAAEKAFKPSSKSEKVSTMLRCAVFLWFTHSQEFNIVKQDPAQPHKPCSRKVSMFRKERAAKTWSSWLATSAQGKAWHHVPTLEWVQTLEKAKMLQ